MNKAEFLVLFYLLQDKDHVGKSYRDIAAATGVSLGSVHTTMADLSERGYLVASGRGRALRKCSSLVDWWARGYADMLKRKCFLSRFTFLTAQVREQWQEIDLFDSLTWGGEPAAALMGYPIQPGRWDIYTPDNANALILTGRMIPNPSGEIYVYKKFWNTPGIPLMVVYADLLYSDDARCREVAQIIKTKL